VDSSRDGRNGGARTCGAPDEPFTENEIVIPNDVFEAMTNILVEAISEDFFAC